MTVPAAHRPSRRSLLAAAAFAPLAVAGCQGSPATDASSGRSPFTGDGAPGRKVLAVKIDNIRSARPSTGVESADLVYAEQVEAGLSRLMAVFASRLPQRVGPVRSARESDLELLRQFDQPALAYSGVQSSLRAMMDTAPLTPLTPQTAPESYLRSQDRAAPHNLFLDPAAALRAAADAGAPADIGFRFGSAPQGGSAAKHREAHFPDASFGFDWSARRRRWLVSMDGEPATTSDGGRLSAATVVLQYVTVRDSTRHDVNGELTPFTESVGKGRAEVLRDGRAYDGRWSRPSAGSGTSFTDRDGNPLPFARGPVWVVLTPTG